MSGEIIRRNEPAEADFGLDEIPCCSEFNSDCFKFKGAKRRFLPRIRKFLASFREPSSESREFRYKPKILSCFEPTSPQGFKGVAANYQRIPGLTREPTSSDGQGGKLTGFPAVCSQANTPSKIPSLNH